MTKDLLSAYIAIGQANNLIHVKDNIFVNKHGVRLYFDQLGFHTVNQYYSSKLLRIITRSKVLLSDIVNLNNIDKLGKKTRRAIRKILLANNLTPSDKVKLALEYLDAAPDNIKQYNQEIEVYVTTYLTNNKEQHGRTRPTDSV